MRLLVVDRPPSGGLTICPALSMDMTVYAGEE